jgi:hypothetical protein
MRKQIIFNVTGSDHQAIKLEATIRKMTIRDFIMYCVRKTQKEERNKKEGY